MNVSHESNEPSQPIDRVALDWQAWLYVAGEMDDAAREAFETRLLDDVAACEAVARAVELSDLMAAATPALSYATAIPTAAPAYEIDSAAEVVPAASYVSDGIRSREGWSQRVGWMALGAAACLAVMLATRAWRIGQLDDAAGVDEKQEIVATAEDDAPALAAAWTELWNADDSTSRGDADDDTLARDDSVLSDAASDDRNSTPPDWLLAAVTGDDADGAPPSAPAPN